MPSFHNGPVEIAYLDEGQETPGAEPIVLVHGFASTKEKNWVEPGWVDTLTKAGRRVIALDNRGHGQSSKLYDPVDYHTSLLADDVRALLDHLSIERADVFGYSMGARITAFLALAHPERVRSAILGGLGMHLVQSAGLPMSIADALEASSIGDVTDAQGRLFRAFADQTKSDRRALAACIRGTRQTLSREQVASIPHARHGRGRLEGRNRRVAPTARRTDPQREAPGHSEPRPHAGGRRPGVQGGRFGIPSGAGMTTLVEPVLQTFTGANGNKLIGDVTGHDGPPVLLLHGGGQTRHAWRKTGDLIARMGRVAYAIDQRGHGDSEWVADGAYGFPDYGADARALSAQIAARHGVEPVAVGASLGGIASLIAEGGEGRPNGHTFSALVLVDITPRVDLDGVAKVHGFMRAHAQEGFATVEEAADAVAAYLPHRPRPRSTEGLKKNLRLHPDGRWRWHWDPRFLDGRRRIGPGGGEIEQMLVAAAKRITIPTLLVRGGSSELVQEEHAKDLLRLVPHATYVDVSGARHMVAGDRNDQFANAIKSFLSNLQNPS